MKHHRIFSVGILFLFCCFLIYFVYIGYPLNIQFSLSRNRITRHRAIILARRPSVKILSHLNTLLNVGVDAFLMSDENPSNYTNMTERILYVNDESLVQYGLNRNRVWDRVFIWLYNQSSFDYVWLIEDDLTWTHVQHMINLFNRYANDPADLLSRNIIYKTQDSS